MNTKKGNSKERLTEIKHNFLHVRRCQFRNLDLVVRNIWSALKSPESTTADGVLFPKVNIILRSRWGQLWEGHAHKLGGLVASGQG